VFHRFLRYFFETQSRSNDEKFLVKNSLFSKDYSAYQKEWQRALKIKDISLLNERLAWSNVSDKDKLESFLHALPLAWELISSEEQKCVLDWLVDSISLCPEESIKHQILPVNLTDLPFAHIWNGVYNEAWKLISTQNDYSIIASHLDDNFDNSQAILDLVTDLSRAFEATLFEEFEKFRSKLISKRLEREIAKDSSIYFKFIDELMCDRFRTFLKTYPCLAFRASNIISSWKTSTTTFLSRFSHDKKKLIDYFGLPPDVALRSFKPGLGDKHNKGQSAVLISLVSLEVEDFRLIYKPVPINMLKCFNRFIDGLNKLGSPYLFHCIEAIDFGNYGYVEYVEYEPCSSIDENELFNLNLGALSAVLYLLRANDCHYENIIARGASPILVDCETIMQPLVRNQEDDFERIVLKEGIQRTGLIGSWQWNINSGIAIESGTVGLNKKALENISTRQWNHLNSDRMNLEFRAASIDIIQCLPDQSIPRKEFVAKKHSLLLMSFQLMSKFLISIAADETLSHLLQDCFRDATSRVLIRDTSVYGEAIHGSSSPAYASSYFKSGLLFEKLLSPFDSYKRSQDLFAIFCSEVDQLQLDDIPIFFSRVSSTCLNDGLGTILVEDYAELSALDAVINTLPNLKNNLEDQSILFNKYLSISLSTSYAEASHQTIKQWPINNFSKINQNELYCEAAKAVGDLILQECLFLNDGLLWSKLEVANDKRAISLEPISSSCYDGYLGILVFLDELASATNFLAESNWRASKLDAVFNYFLDSLLHTILELPEKLFKEWLSRASLGLDGLGGALIAFKILSNSSYLDVSRLSLIDQVIDLIVTSLSRVSIESKSCDIMHGEAGLISGLLFLDNDQSIAMASQLGNRLCSKQLKNHGWPNDQYKIDQISFSHGSCGISASLASLYGKTGDHKIFTSAMNGYQHQNSYFDSQILNWPDLRNFSDEIIRLSSLREGANCKEKVFSSAWCSGASGSLISRIVAINSGLFWNELTTEILSALRSVTASNEINRFHLCCGLSGCSAVIDAVLNDSKLKDMLEAEDLVLIEEFRVQSLEKMMEGLQKNHTKIAISGIQGVTDVAPGLFDGLAGIGLTLLSGASPSTSAKQRSLLSAGLL